MPSKPSKLNLKKFWEGGYYVGYGFADPRRVESLICGICDSKMNVERNVMGPTSWAEAMAKREHLHDSFECPNLREKWHERVVDLVQEGYDTQSRAFRKIIRDEILEILETKKVPD